MRVRVDVLDTRAGSHDELCHVVEDGVSYQ